MPTILKRCTSVGARFWMYEILKARCVKNEQIGMIKTMIGGFAGSFSAAINQPFDQLSQ